MAVAILGELPPLPVAIPFPQGPPYGELFNQVIQELKASSELDQMARQWFTINP
jgi:ABC-type amino acid transport substrate-binding protein